jgi:threonine aldolase
MLIDYRSDTFTRPSPEMLDAMMTAHVGDDVFGEDPTVNELETFAAAMFGKEAALYSPTGTMSNQIAIKCHTQPGDEVICEKNAHVYIYEGGGIAFNSAAQVKCATGDRGRIDAAQITEMINADDVHKAKTSLVCLENTSNRGGGSCYDFKKMLDIKEVCLHNNLQLHLDGARLFNALVKKKETPQQYGEVFNSISVCLNKGLGCPVGSLLMGSNDFIKKARRVRKVLGGGMRQAGYMAATGLYALQNNVERLAYDHQHAHYLAEALLRKDFVGHMLPVETNIIIFEIKGRHTAKSFVVALHTQDILCLPISPTQVRMVTHLDVSEDMIAKTLEVIDKL